jgi:hypothetical protein
MGFEQNADVLRVNLCFVVRNAIVPNERRCEDEDLTAI